MEVHRNLGPGFFEKVYEKALAQELAERKIPFEIEEPIPVVYKRAKVGKYRADFLVDGKIVVEIKAISCFVSKNEAQVLHYLTAKKLRLALLLNFGTPSLTFKRIIK